MALDVLVNQDGSKTKAGWDKSTAVKYTRKATCNHKRDVGVG
jgi:hypothetical protein